MTKVEKDIPCYNYIGGKIMKIIVPLAPGCEEIEAITIIKHKKYELFSFEFYFKRKVDCLLPLDVVGDAIKCSKRGKADR